jgi:Lipocalin-like domain
MRAWPKSSRLPRGWLWNASETAFQIHRRPV